MSDLEHAVRNSLIDRDTTFTLAPGALGWHTSSDSGEIAYADIARLNLISYAGSGSEIFQAKISPRTGRPLKLRSHSYLSLGNFEDRRATYAPFVRELIRRVAGAAPEAQFVAGNTGLFITWLVVVVLLVILLLAVLLVLFSGPAGPSLFIAIGVLVIGGPIAWRQLRKGGAKPFDPENPPPTLLGL